ncbi:MAG TPA: hypothetical protein VGR30_15630, partial [Candidatus Binatia bacterium]|nr:hypothetical protein [Candidatus Binatia bacterium]
THSTNPIHNDLLEILHLIRKPIQATSPASLRDDAGTHWSPASRNPNVSVQFRTVQGINT